MISTGSSPWYIQPGATQELRETKGAGMAGEGSFAQGGREAKADRRKVGTTVPGRPQLTRSSIYLWAVTA